MAVDFGRERVLCGQMGETQTLIRPLWSFETTSLPTVRVARLGKPGDAPQVQRVEVFRQMKYKDASGNKKTLKEWFPLDIESGAMMQDGTPFVLTMIKPVNAKELRVAKEVAANF